jgi:cysteine desulfurase
LDEDVGTMTSEPIYLDHNASTPVTAEVFAAMAPYLTEHFGNPSSSHVYGRRARAAIDEAREKVAAAIGARAEEIVFTSGGTEASNLAILGTAGAQPERAHVITTTIEHPATSEPCAHLERGGTRVTRLGTDRSGVVDLVGLLHALESRARLVTVIHAHNETGVIQPMAEIAARARATGALVHADAAQSLGKIPVHVDALGVDLLSIAGHKLGAPKGVGVLYVRAGTPIAPVVRGAGHERGLRPGTENVASIVGLGVACASVSADLEVAASRMRALREQLWGALLARVPDLARHGDPSRLLPNTLSVRFPNVRGADVLAHAPAVAASTGSACHDGHDVAPAAIVAMGILPASALGTVRLTLGRSTTGADVERASEALASAFRRLAR